MQITVFGASGKVGRQVVRQALERGWQVTAFVHHNNPFVPHPRLTIVTGELDDTAAISRAIAGSDSVISTLGSWHTNNKTILTVGMRHILPAMKEQGLRRIITLTGAGALWSGDRPSAMDKRMHRLLGLAAPQILRDGERHLRLLAASDLEWTCIRSPIMTRRASTHYRLTNTLAPVWALIPRAAVTQCLLDQADNTTWGQQAPVIRAH